MSTPMLSIIIKTRKIWSFFLKICEKNSRVKELPTISYVKRLPTLCAQKLYVGHYKDASEVFESMKSELSKLGYRPTQPWRAIYLLPAMGCYPAHNSKTVVSVDIEKI